MVAALTKSGEHDALLTINGIDTRLRELDHSPLPPIKLREAYENVVIDLLEASGVLKREAIQVLFGPIQDKGIWRTATDPTGLPYSEFALYARDFLSNHWSRIEERTVYGYIGTYREMKQIGVSSRDAAGLIADMPSVASRALGLADTLPDGTLALNPQVRAKIEAFVGIDEESSAEMSDKKVLQEFLPKLGELKKSDASAVIASVASQVKVFWYYNAETKQIVVVAHKKGGDFKPVEARFNQDTRQPIAKVIRDWLMDHLYKGG